MFLFVEVDVYHPLKRVPPLTPQSKSHSGLVSVQLFSGTWPSRLFRRFLTNVHSLGLQLLVAALTDYGGAAMFGAEKIHGMNARLQTKLTVAVCVLA